LLSSLILHPSSLPLPGPLFIGLSRAGGKTTLITLAQLAARAPLERTFIRTQTRAPVYRKHTLNFRMGSGDYVHTDKFTNSSSCSGARVSRRFHGTDIPAHKYRYVPCADVLLTEQLHVRGLDHRVSGFNSTDESLGLDHSECF
jgi:hypothetical protein